MQKRTRKRNVRCGAANPSRAWEVIAVWVTAGGLVSSYIHLEPAPLRSG